MRIHELAALAEAAAVKSSERDDELKGGYTSDLLSDVMANASSGQVLTTIQAHKNTVAVASIVGIPAIVICNGREIPEDMAEAAREENIALFRTALNQFEVSGRIWSALRS